MGNDIDTISQQGISTFDLKIRWKKNEKGQMTFSLAMCQCPNKPNENGIVFLPTYTWSHFQCCSYD